MPIRLNVLMRLAAVALVLSAACEKKGAKARAFVCDVGNAEQVANQFKAAIDWLGGVDCLVNNAGLGYFARFDELALLHFEEMLATNLRGPFLCAQAVLPAMKKAGDGLIINLSSIAGKYGSERGAGYCASKFGLMAMNAWPNNYALRLEASRLVLWTERNGYGQDLASANLAIGTTWHSYRIDALNHQITIRVDDSVVLTFTDSAEGSLRGGIGLEAYAADGARFDDIFLYSVTPQCYDGIQNGDETGVDCGGSCPFQDCCTNRAWDAGLGEDGVDCGGGCSLACQPTDSLDHWMQTNGPCVENIRVGDPMSTRTWNLLHSSGLVSIVKRCYRIHN